MKFGDKLIKLRKRKGMNQEELAEKLGVSRQSVSKWESNNAYPETDKIVQICNIFNCSMDDLINDNITDIDEIQRKDKNNFNIAIDSFLEFITKSINMFSKMKFTSGLKCVIEMIILTLILALVGNIISDILSSAISSIFVFTQKQEIISNILYSIFIIIWIIIEFIILVHTFKIRYLNYYDNKDDNNNEKETIIKNNDKIIIRDENHRPFAFLSVLSSIIIIFAKMFLFCFGICFIFSLIGLSFSLIISIFLTPNSMMFFGIDITLISMIIINAIILALIMCFIFNKNIKLKKLLILFLSSIIFTGVGIGISALSVKNIKIIDKDISKFKISEELIDYKDNLVTLVEGLKDTEYEIDNSMDKIKIQITYNDKLFNYNIKEDDFYGLSTYEIHYNENDLSPKDVYDIFIKDIKKNIFIKNNYTFDVKVIANEETINKLLDNLSKAYNFDKKEKENGYYITNMLHKINKDDYCEEKTDYNAITGEISTSGDCKCNKDEHNGYININCNYEN